MPWVRFDDRFTVHRKVKGLSDAAFRLHAEAIFWCARDLMDGFVPTADLPDLATARRPLKSVPELVVRGLWHLADEACDSEKCPAHVDNRSESVDKGWFIHDYFEYQPTKQKVHHDRKAKAERQRRWSEKRKGGVDASADASIDAAPYPPRPEGSGAGARRPARASGRAHPSGSPVRAVPDWCEKCDHPNTRLVETGDGSVTHCPDCHPKVVRPA